MFKRTAVTTDTAFEHFRNCVDETTSVKSCQSCEKQFSTLINRLSSDNPDKDRIIVQYKSFIEQCRQEILCIKDREMCEKSYHKGGKSIKACAECDHFCYKRKREEPNTCFFGSCSDNKWYANSKYEICHINANRPVPRVELSTTAAEDARHASLPTFISSWL